MPFTGLPGSGQETTAITKMKAKNNEILMDLDVQPTTQFQKGKGTHGSRSAKTCLWVFAKNNEKKTEGQSVL